MPPLSKTEFAPAKVNLTLHVTGQRQDGYHLLDSLVVFCDIGDLVTVANAPDIGLQITGAFGHLLAADDDNLVIRAARLLQADQGAAIVLRKDLPLASGIGGGSADAAATLRALSALWNVPMPQAQDSLALGADVPVCLFGRPARMQGIGESITLVDGLPDLHIVLVNPGITVPTPLMFRALASKQNAGMPGTFPKWSDAASFARWLATQRNDLEIPACAYAPDIAAVLEDLSRQPGALIARMSGSGATCFGLFATQTDAQCAEHDLRRTQPAWWVASGQIKR